MKRLDFRILLGAALILLGALMLLERFGLFHGAAGIFWGLVFLAGGGYFLYRFALAPNAEWWAVIPGSALVGIGASALFPDRWGGLLFLGFLGAGFLVVYLTGRRERWWSLIPGGVLVTLGVVSVLTDVFGARETGGIFFIGLGLTFLLVAVLVPAQWAYAPALVLLLMGAVLGYTPFGGYLNYVWPAALILAGLILILQFARRS